MQKPGGYTTASTTRASPLVLALFSGTLLSSAGLLFAVQPIFTKMVLPLLGGAPAVWSVAMCFFQVVLLAGYAYAHWLDQRLQKGTAVAVHVLVMVLAFSALPLGLAADRNFPQGEDLSVYIWVLGLFAVSIGLPFFALAANAPLLQAWFAGTGHPHAKDPYFLYGASNLGSLTALLSYPVLIEPWVSLSRQSLAWSAGYQGLVICVALCGTALLLTERKTRLRVSSKAPDTTKSVRSTRPVTLRKGVVWAGLAFAPSGLLVAVTSHISTDVAAAPLLWVLPLSLFLLTFILTFQRRPLLPHKAMLALQPAAVAALFASIGQPAGAIWPLSTGLHLLIFFILAMACHGELVRRRPEAGQLTHFYLWMSLGGALGGLFAGLIAPNLFQTIFEYPLIALLSLLARPGLFATPQRTWTREGSKALALLALAFLTWQLLEDVINARTLYTIITLAFATTILLARTHPGRLLLLATAMLTASVQFEAARSRNTDHYRSFFGVTKVKTSRDGAFRLFFHGTTLHGMQELNADPDRPPEPLSYYHDGSPFPEGIAAARKNSSTGNTGVIGLGVGTLACYRQEGENWKFYEIDPQVISIASDPSLFTYLSECAPNTQIATGDARLLLEKEPDGFFDLLIFDAFSSDAVPVHLITREAVGMYLRKLSRDGIALFHISNRHLDLEPVMAAVAREQGLDALIRKNTAYTDHNVTKKYSANVVAMARDPSHLASLAEKEDWHPLKDQGWGAWNDDYSSILRALLAQQGFLKEKP